MLLCVNVAAKQFAIQALGAVPPSLLGVRVNKKLYWHPRLKVKSERGALSVKTPL